MVVSTKVHPVMAGTHFQCLWVWEGPRSIPDSIPYSRTAEETGKDALQMCNLLKTPTGRMAGRGEKAATAGLFLL